MIRALDDVQIMLDDQHTAARFAEPLEYLQQSLHVVYMQSRSRLVENIERAPRVSPAQLGCEFYALRLAAGELRARLTDLDIAQAHIVERLQFPCDLRQRLKEAKRFLHRHIEHIIDVFAFVVHFQRFAIITLSAADLAGNVDIRQEVHLNLDDAVSVASLASAALDVETEASVAVAAHSGIRRIGKHCTDEVE